MNKQRRNELSNIIDELNSIHGRLVEVTDAEQEAFDNMPEGLQMSERGELMEQNVSDLADAYDELEGVISSIEDVLDNN